MCKIASIIYNKPLKKYEFLSKTGKWLTEEGKKSFNSKRKYLKTSKREEISSIKPEKNIFFFPASTNPRIIKTKSNITSNTPCKVSEYENNSLRVVKSKLATAMALRKSNMRKTPKNKIT